MLLDLRSLEEVLAQAGYPAPLPSLSTLLSPVTIGVLAGTATLTLGQTGSIAGAGALSGTAALNFSQTGAIKGAGALSGTVTLTFGQTGAVTGAGTLTASTTLTFGQTGALTGAGVLAGSTTLTFGQTGTLTGSGLLSGVSALIFGATGTADVPSGALSGTAALTLGASGTLSASGTLAGIAAMLLDASATLTTSGITQPGPVDSPRMAQGGYRRKKHKRPRSAPQLAVVSTAIAVPGVAPAQEPRPKAPDFESLARLSGLTLEGLRAEVDDEIAELMSDLQERDDEEALTLILASLD